MKLAPAALAIALVLASAAAAKDKAVGHKPAHHETKAEKKARARTETAKAGKLAKGKHAKTQATKPTEKPARRHVARAPVEDDSDLSSDTVHLVKPGETLGGIAHRAKVPRVLIAEANHLPKPWQVHAGQKLNLPRTGHHVVKAGETGFDISYQYGVPYSAIAVANGLSPRAVLKPGQELLIPTVLAPPVPAAAAPDKDEATAAARDDNDDAPAPAKKAATAFTWPLDGAVRRGFTPRTSRNYHDGIDIVATPGATVRAADAGTVIFAGREPKSYGNLVVIQHSNGWQSAYGFLGKITVKQGDPIRKRERLGLVGHTGKATRDELHFEVRKANKPVDPIDSLPAH